MQNKTLALSAVVGAAQAAMNSHTLAQVDADLTSGLEELTGLTNQLVQTRLHQVNQRQVLSQTRHKKIDQMTPVNSVFA